MKNDMEFNEILSAKVDQMRQEELKDMPILSLGEIIAKLEAIAEIEKERKEEPWVTFDFASVAPTTLESWRGVYAELALGFNGEHNAKWPKLSEMLSEFKGAVGKTFTGWKGGDFKMGRSTPVWVANCGNVGNTGIVGVRNGGYEVILETAEIRD